VNPKLSILIPTTPDRWEFNKRLDAKFHELCGQGYHKTYPTISFTYTTVQYPNDVEIIWCHDNKEFSIGSKRNALLLKASGDYLAFIDSDDLITEHYFKEIFKGIEKGVDCCSLNGIITEDGNNPKTFIHSIKYDSWFEKDEIYYRNSNHLNCVRSSIAKQMKFPETNHGEDKSYSEQLLKSGLLKTEHWIEDIIYLYEFRSKK
jgi:glycosyltransferase involved in cell wall biosynthesis